MSQVTDEAVSKAISAIEHIAPKAWGLAVQAQRVDGYTGMAHAAGLWAVAAAVLIVSRRIAEKADYYDKSMISVVGVIIAAAGLVAGAFVLPDAIAHTISPEAFAFRALTP